MTAAASRKPAEPASGAHHLPPHVRLALLKLGAQARNMRARLDAQRDLPGAARRSWPWIRASLPGELDLAMERSLVALQTLHDAVFNREGMVTVREIRNYTNAINGCIGHILGLHREVAAALTTQAELRAGVLHVIEKPLRQLADFFEAMQQALAEPAAEIAEPHADIELSLSIDLDFAAQLAAAESLANGTLAC